MPGHFSLRLTARSPRPSQYRIFALSITRARGIFNEPFVDHVPLVAFVSAIYWLLSAVASIDSNSDLIISDDVYYLGLLWSNIYRIDPRFFCLELFFPSAISILSVTLINLYDQGNF